MRDPVIIVGGGLAGLACAGELEARGVPFRLFEASDRVGGRVRTDEVEGFRLDRGFQVYFPAYPNARLALKGIDLDLRPWRVGALLWDGTRLLTLDRNRPLKTLRDGVLPLADLARLALLSLQAGGRPHRDASTAGELHRRGFSEAAFRRFLRPFYGGVFVDPELRLSRGQFLFVHGMLVRAPAALPNAGMEAIPRALASRFPADRIALETRVDDLLRGPDGRVAGVRAGGERVAASAVVLAVDADAADALNGPPLSRGWLGSVAVYFESEAPACEGAYIVLNGTGQGRVNEVAPLTNCAPGYAPPGRHLLCAVVLGDPKEADAELIEIARRETLAMCPAARSLRFLRLDRIRHHQLPQPSGFKMMYPEQPYSTLRVQALPNADPAPSDLLVAGEVAMNCSIDGAIASGLRVAERLAR